MNNITLAQSYFVKATKRLKILDVLLAEEAYSDVMREAQEIVELSLKAMLRQVGIEPPKWHDVGSLILEYRDRFPESVAKEGEHLADISAYLRKEREASFYGEVDFIPTEQYGREDALKAMADAQFVLRVVEQVIQPGK